MQSTEDDIRRILSEKRLTLESVKQIMRSVRHGRHAEEISAYADSLVPEASDYLSPQTLSALVRADINELEAANDADQNRAFFSRLVVLLPSLIDFFRKKNNMWGIINCIDDCHNDFHVTAKSRRRDRQERETKELLEAARNATAAAAASIEKAKRLLDIEFDRYSKLYLTVEERPRHLEELIDELNVCSSVAEILSASIDLEPKHPFKRLFLSGSDKRTAVVERAYHMSTMWDGPKLVTTPGSDFSNLCSLLFEAVSGDADESLSGAINRYARSDDRKQWDREGEEEDDENDNFRSVKQWMRASIREIEMCTSLQQVATLSTAAKDLLNLQIATENKQLGKALTTYGPHQVLFEHLNEEQQATIFSRAISHWKPEEQEKLFEQLEKGTLMADLDIALGKARRDSRAGKVDV